VELEAFDRLIFNPQIIPMRAAAMPEGIKLANNFQIQITFKSV
jgi:hypothetical protein